MNSENVVKHLRALWRTDRIIADIRLRQLLIGLGLRAFAAVDNLANSRDKKLDAAQPTFDRPDYGRTLRVGVQFNFRSR